MVIGCRKQISWEGKGYINLLLDIYAQPNFKKKTGVSPEAQIVALNFLLCHPEFLQSVVGEIISLP